MTTKIRHRFPTRAERRERKRRPRMAVSGRGVLVIQRLKREKAR